VFRILADRAETSFQRSASLSGRRATADFARFDLEDGL
jgi:hypothetical protein